ncbi:MAG TPA: hypothetical protein VIL31_11275 [Cyclobacteriaceae bacterium]|jgi:hypothetical protein
MTKTRLLTLTVLIGGCIAAALPVETDSHNEHSDDSSSAIIVVPATDFLYDLPHGNTMTDAQGAGVSWLFNNTGIVLKSLSNMITRVNVPEGGRYHLFVRSVGSSQSSFRVAINDKVTDVEFGQDSVMWKRGGVFELTEGVAAVKITRIRRGSIFDVIVLSRDSTLSEEDIIPLELHPDVRLIQSYEIPPAGAVKFGDVNGDGKTDFTVLERDFSAHVFDNSGKLLWSWKAPEAYARERSGFEAPGVMWDFDSDGKAEVVHWRFMDDAEWLVIADGQSGKVRYKAPWPTQPLPHVYNNFRLAIGKLTSGRPNEIIVFTDMGGTINVSAYSPSLKQLWQHTERRAKDHLGHYVYPVDVDGDGIDEVLAGPMLLEASGRVIWNRYDLFFDNHDHPDNYKFSDIDHDGDLDIISAHSETGVFVFDGMTGNILWQETAEHSQQVEVGDFLDGVDGPQVVIGARTYGNRQAGEPYLSSQLFWFDNKGRRISRWPGKPLNGNPDFVKGNWKGDGHDELFWFKFRINAKGEGEFFFPDPAYHMFDFTGRGAEEVVTLSQGKLAVYGSASAKYSGRDSKRDPLYLKSKVVNHTHY